MIPKIIHYCWFGGKPFPAFAKKCAASWKRYAPDYQFVLWNEDNFDAGSAVFTQQAADAKRWAFIADYVRAHAIFSCGGIYLDTDVELLRPLDDLLIHNKSFSGFELELEGVYEINPGSIFAGEQHSIIAGNLLDFYSGHPFKGEDGVLDLTPIPKIMTRILLSYGLKQDNTLQTLGEFTAYPSDYFSPRSLKTGKTEISANTYSIHYYDASWKPPLELICRSIEWRLPLVFGYNKFSGFLIKCGIAMVHVVFRLFNDGPAPAIRHYIKKIGKRLMRLKKGPRGPKIPAGQ